LPKAGNKESIDTAPAAIAIAARIRNKMESREDSEGLLSSDTTSEATFTALLSKLRIHAYGLS
jgi:hypothetical protein